MVFKRTSTHMDTCTVLFPIIKAQCDSFTTVQDTLTAVYCCVVKIKIKAEFEEALFSSPIL